MHKDGVLTRRGGARISVVYTPPGPQANFRLARRREGLKLKVQLP